MWYPGLPFRIDALIILIARHLVTDGSEWSLPEIALENYLAQVYTLTRRNQPPVTIQYVSSKTSLVPQQFWRSVWVSELFMESVKADHSLLSLTFLALSQMFMRVLFNKLPKWKCFSQSFPGNLADIIQIHSCIYQNISALLFTNLFHIEMLFILINPSMLSWKDIYTLFIPYF